MEFISKLGVGILGNLDTSNSNPSTNISFFGDSSIFVFKPLHNYIKDTRILGIINGSSDK